MIGFDKKRNSNYSVPQVRKCIKIHWEANLNKKLLIAKAHPTKGMIGCLNSRS